MEIDQQTVKAWTHDRLCVALKSNRGSLSATVADRISRQAWEIAPCDIQIDGVRSPLPFSKLNRVLENTHVIVSPCQSTFRLYVRQNGVGGMDREVGREEVCFVVEGKEIRCPREPLCNNAYFSALLSNGMRESTASRITVKEVSHDTFLILVDYLAYNRSPIGRLSLLETIDLYRAAKQFLVEGLCKVIEGILQRSVRENADKLCGLFQEAPSRTHTMSHPPRADAEELMGLERGLLVVWNFALEEGLPDLEKACSVEKSCSISTACPTRPHLQKYASGTLQTLSNRAIYEKDKTGFHVQYHFSPFALGFAVRNGFSRLLPKLAIPLQARVATERNKEQYSEVENCFASNVSVADYNIWTLSPVDGAIQGGCIEVIKWLVDHSEASSHFNSDHLRTAITYHYLEIAAPIGERLLRRSTAATHPSQKNRHQRGQETACFDQVREGIDHLLDALYEAKDETATRAFLTKVRGVISPSAPPAPIFTFAANGNTKWISLYWDALMIDPAAQDPTGDGLLHHATRRGQTQMINWLMKRRVPTSMKNSRGETPLHLAASSQKRLGILQTLTNGNAKVDVRDDQGNTPLHSACRTLQPKAALLLLQKGATLIGPPNKSGQQPLDIPASQGKRHFITKFFDLLASSNDQRLKDEALGWAGFRKGGSPRYAYYELVEKMVDSGADLNITDSKQATLLHYTAQYGLAKATSFLLQRKAVVDAVDDQGQTPLHRAASGGHPALVRLLLGGQATARVWDSSGRTPYQLAHEGLEKDQQNLNYLEVVQLLEDRECHIQ